MVSRPSAAESRRLPSRRIRLAPKRPAPASSTTPSATSHATRVARARCRSRPAVWRGPSRAGSGSRRRPARNPKSSVARPVRPTATSIARPSMVASCRRTRLGGATASAKRSTPCATSRPSAAPKAPSKALSATSRRIKSTRRAPSDCRIESSPSRGSVAAKRSPARLAVAISSTRPTAPRMPSRSGRRSPKSCSCSGMTTAPGESYSFGCSLARATLRALSSARASARVTPGRRRASVRR